ncbi:glycylpeptide N-tetradecanoyltransferase [Coemansia sp. RSA 2706]|nr:glycylpeptide N-tetradecanoyltransferase [Coemansia sp. RSA 2711]KAJ2305273.1 glycylpeptide N-tetradecanoyltransferase [Coemansia sp. RSA 2706]KAJ2312232.1 glycylpeptide N-tetradecanoyltransferase [Coemansia sp. RSA 2705]
MAEKKDEQPAMLSTEKLRELIRSLDMQADPTRTRLEREAAAEKDAVHEFWSTQPVPQSSEVVKRDGALHPPLAPEQIPQEPYALPTDAMEWCVVDVEDAGEMKELYSLLTENYVEDSDSMFRFNYSADFLTWALMPPGYQPEWHVGVRDASTKKLIAFISGVPLDMMVRDKTMAMAEINFLCLHKSLRGQRMTPLLIKEVTRRIHLKGVFQAVYTVGKLLPKPVSTCRYFHRSLDPKKLMETGFSQKLSAPELAKVVSAMRLPAATALPGLRLMRKGDLGQVRKLLNRFLKRRFEIVPVFRTDAEIAHWLMPRSGVVWTYVVDDPERPGRITDFFSFYSLPSAVLKEGGARGRASARPTYKSVNAAYLFYYGTRDEYDVVLSDAEKQGCGGAKQEKQLLKAKTNALIKERLLALMGDALVLAKNSGFDVFNCLDMMDNSMFIRELRFGPGDGYLRYYLYNYRAREIESPRVGFVML